MSVTIHPMSVVDPKARLGAGVQIGPFCTVGPDVTLADNVELISHVAVSGITSIGERTKLYPFASIGHPPQDVKYRGEPSTLVIGAECLIREGVTINPGTEGGGMETTVGDRCFFLANSHVGHDSHIGNNVIFSNNVMCAGHVTVGNFVIVGGGTGLQQFIRVGDHAFIGGGAGVMNDVIPFGLVRDNPAHLAGLNLVGLKRRGFSREQIHELRRAYRLLFADEGTLSERVEDVASEFAAHPLIHEILDFIRNGNERAICVPRDVNAPDR
ncbi:acyl-ACP--UDP-N-acetylglucosamine O-acyltransferase [Bosea psychrotolerans]|uniref:Acyl-[acyl-carrier-protein]--UDP-N-acetylglucosamine O-acyltransferase n=1 Tax=Bosea psychrotolerans TaxID=1871628 RepID=A0A2S4ML15_9HYPH|nr:acyl-ACP--UDP-N-acetylglucosamine O-acyltransferase [Bosea psychrotolerans]POR55361.1 acyl-[acyl-carrier-protein]--UDP-N-acetylglucosamine O-acyltransferase [Bosea psychrotolerans]